MAFVNYLVDVKHTDVFSLVDVNHTALLSWSTLSMSIFTALFITPFKMIKMFTPTKKKVPKRLLKHLLCHYLFNFSHKGNY